MNMSDWSNWTVQERCVAELIIEIFEKKDPSGTTGFLPENIYGEHYDHLKAMWVPKKSSSADRQKVVIQIFNTLVNRGQFIKQNRQATLYYLVRDGWLYQELQRRNRYSHSSSVPRDRNLSHN